MKFLYEYRTPDNAKHNGVICASDREAAYAQLKKQGIKPCRFAEAPGILNKLFGKGKRWIAICVLALALAVSLAFALRPSGRPFEIATFDSLTRRQVIGDVALIDQGIRDGWAAVFPEEGERFLASFAIPGVPAGLRNTTEAEVKAALSRKVVATAEDSIEARQIKAMVEGMKQELREFLADGGTVRQYGNRLVQRQESELAYYRRAKTEVERAFEGKASDKELSALLTKYNTGLRRMGIKLLVMPE